MTTSYTKSPGKQAVSSAELSKLKKTANAADRRCERAAQSMLEYARECGEALIKIKGIVGHGSFEAWIEKNCEFSTGQARRYMLIANGWEKILNLSKPAHARTICRWIPWQSARLCTSCPAGGRKLKRNGSISTGLARHAANGLS